MRKARILIVDDHPVVRRGLAMLIDIEPDMEICGEADSVLGGLEAAEKTLPDMVLVDISLKDSDGIQLIRQLKTIYPRIPALAISMHDETIYAERALRAGARGYITKQAAENSIVSAIRRVLGGGIYLSESALDRLARRFISGVDSSLPSPIDLLSDREFEVFRLIGRGLSVGQIAASLHRSVKTVETHQTHIKTKLELATARDLSEFAVAWMKAHPA